MDSHHALIRCGGKVANSSNRDLIGDLLVELRDGLGSGEQIVDGDSRGT
jgi:hypothetical protein